MEIFGVVIAFFITLAVSFFSVSTGGTSLIMVPVLISLGMPPKNAIATNMFGLIFLSIGGTVGFRKHTNDKARLLPLSLLTVIGSAAGAALILIIDPHILRRILAVIVCLIAVFVIFNNKLGIDSRKKPLPARRAVIGSSVIFILGIYGGFFSGGYVTVLSYALILLFGTTFLEAAFVSKVLNVFSSTAACLIFYKNGLIDFSIAMPLAVSMTAGAFFGAKVAVVKGNAWVRNAMIVATIAMAVKLLIF
ncbi:MAG: TSUP family transporter [Candidatus Omnitrophica bacterium]|nr:TSUP family transporter [Candidatus Omnitrophota bacterium]